MLYGRRMTQKPTPPTNQASETPEGDRIAKVLSRAGVASRREAERMIAAGRIMVNGKVIDSPALNVTKQDRIVVDNQPLPEAEDARMWLYYKPIGLVTTNRDEKGRTTIFDELPEELPRVMTVGRLDLNSEGLLLLTNDGGIKRKLELPETGWLRRYRVRINGRPRDADFEPLRKGLVIEGEKFQPMIVTLDRQQGANAWITVGLREGKNREIRRAMEDIGFAVNRLLRISYGPFQLGELKPGEVEEVRRRVLHDQLGLERDDTAKPKRPTRARKPGKPHARNLGSDSDRSRQPTQAKGNARTSGTFKSGASSEKSRGKPARGPARSQNGQTNRKNSKNPRR
ncbi:23S rRNA pseudouridine2605 synthase [Epibacterium ulvae]|uniref:Pseudouridine synthase n=2 Tax=Epibacterium ulvae TaxID=1156985 RepID=A0A1G5PXB3_9RHOB|nr:23S rRNA pseudouridine2605 synthase [Epibacterium ulvae]